MSHDRGEAFLAELPSIRHDLPFSPALMDQLFSMTGEEATASLDDIAKTIARDQGLTAKILTMANSAYYGLQSEVRTVGRAVAVIGLNELRCLVLALGVNTLAKKHELPREFDMTDYWAHQLGVAMAAGLVARRLGGLDADNLFTAGVLHDLGKLLTALHRPDDWRAIQTEMATTGLSYHEAEDVYWGLDHGLIGAMLLNSWNLPRELTEPVNWHHAPSHAPEARREAIILCLADALVHHLEAPEAILPCPWRNILQKLRLEPEAILDELSRELAERDPAAFSAALG